jgi:poly(3-hydroxybutyrate) depolymerase
MGNHISKLCTAAFVAALCGTASAYTLSGTVSDNDGNAVKDAKVTLKNLNQSATTDADGKFSIHEDENDQAIRMAQKLGSFSLNNGVLNFTQGASTPVQVKVFDLVGNQVFNKTLQGSGSIDLNAVVDAQGTYVARVKLGSTQQTIRFNANSNHSGSFGTAKSKALLKEVAPGGEPLQVIATGFDTLNVKLSSLDTTVALKLTKKSSLNPEEQTYAFGFALKNAPRPSKGCGTTSTLKKTKSVENGDHFEININGTKREYFVTLPKNYDNNKPHKLLFAMHCLGSSAEDFVHHSPDFDHPSPYYGQQQFDKEGNYIFVAPQGLGENGMPWSMSNDKDHKFFDQLLTTLEDNLCIDTSRVFLTGFSFGAMYSTSLAWSFQHRIRAVAAYAPVDEVIWMPQKNAGKPLAWMSVHGQNDGTCRYQRDLTSLLPTILKNNGKADANGNFTDASAEKPVENQGNTGHTCYDFKTVDERFPVKFCSWPGPHQWTAHDTGNMNTPGYDWEGSWVPEEARKWFEQF